MSVRDDQPGIPARPYDDAAPARVTFLRTSSYAAWRPEFGAPVVTSLTTPKWLPEAKTWPKLWPATPRWSYFHASDFDRHYIAQLERYGARQIARRLAEIARSGFAEPADRLVLMCWEVNQADCHRGVFARWWLETTGEKIEEVQFL
jgi:hypothetical protein